jgi:phosphate transport system substrate-binding protein
MKRWGLGTAVAAAWVQLAQPAAAQDQIWIVGSSTVQPFTTAVAHRAAKAAGGPAPVIEDTGTALAFDYLCGGTGAGYPNAASVTRRMRRSELDVCFANGVKQVVEIPVGLDILVLAQSRAGPLTHLTLDQMFLALAKEVPDRSGALVANPYRKWSEVDAALPDVAIDLRVLPHYSITRDELEELFLRKGAERNPAVARRVAEHGALRKGVAAMRSDRPAISVHETEEAIVRELVANPNAVGVFGYRFLQAHRAKLRGVTIEGADAEQDAYSGKYPGTRTLYIYLRKADIAGAPGLDRLGSEYLSNAALGPGGYLLELGFVPLPMEDMVESIAASRALWPVTRDMLPE